jgi:uncharacterized protein (DUF924 family)
MSTNTIDAINKFWLSDCLSSPEAALARKDWWYAGGVAVDDEIRSRFGDYIVRACNRQLPDWPSTAHGALAIILLLDQFTRNIYRHSTQAYRGDALALEIVKEVIANEHDVQLHPVERIWLYHPFHHAEDLKEQDRGLTLLNEIHRGAQPGWQGYVERSIEGWTRHRNIVARFGRFPHRNDVFGRASTPEEIAFLAQGGETFGQGTK